MKKLLFIGVLMVAITASAQTIQAVWQVPTASHLGTYFGYATRLHVASENQDYVLCPTCTVDGSTVLAGAGGRKWRKFPVSSGSASTLETASQLRHTFFAAPYTGNGVPTFRVIDTSDLPGQIDWQKIYNFTDGVKSKGWALDGNNITARANYIGTNNNRSLYFRTNGIEAMVLDSNKKLGIGTINPLRSLHVAGGEMLLGNAESGVDNIRLIASNGSGHPEITMFNTGVSDGKITLNGSTFTFNSSTSTTGSVTASTQVVGSAGLVSGTTSGGVAGMVALRGNSGNSSFIHFAENGVGNRAAMGTLPTSGDLVFYTNPTNATSFNGTERFRLVNSNGDFLLNTSTDIPASIFTVGGLVGEFPKGSIPTPKLSTAKRNSIISGINGNYTVTGGSGYTNGTYTNIALIGGTGSGAVANITVTSGMVSAFTLTNPGSGYSATDVLSATGLGAGTGFSVTLSANSFYTNTEGIQVFDTDIKKLFVWDGSAWQAAW